MTFIVRRYVYRGSDYPDLVGGYFYAVCVSSSFQNFDLYALHLLTLTLLWFALPQDYTSRNMWMAKSSTGGVWSRCVLWGVVWFCLFRPILKSRVVVCSVSLPRFPTGASPTTFGVSKMFPIFVPSPS